MDHGLRPAPEVYPAVNRRRSLPSLPRAPPLACRTSPPPLAGRREAARPRRTATPAPPVPPLSPGARTEDEKNTIAVFRDAAPSTVFVTQKRVVGRLPRRHRRGGARRVGLGLRLGRRGAHRDQLPRREGRRGAHGHLPGPADVRGQGRRRRAAQGHRRHQGRRAGEPAQARARRPARRRSRSARRRSPSATRSASITR